MKIVTLSIAALASGLAIAAAAMAQDQSPSMASPDATANPAMKSPDDMATTALAKGHNSFTKSQALGRIQKAGFSNVADLVLDSDGIWRANATRNGQPTKVGLDYKGNVAAE